MTRGGLRKGAGRPKGSNQWGESTQALRVPISKVEAVKQFLQTTSYPPLYSGRVKAGFPAMVDDHIELHLDLNAHLIKHPSATFFVRASGDSMIGAGINSGDILIVDRSLEPRHGKIIIAAIDGELTVKRLYKQSGRLQLLAENNAYPPIDISCEQDLIIWGVVTYVIHATEASCLP
ncbi:MAG TPA: translesion error-prone DNA polymerase V autoproteolytic subunit [Legionellaceae bacterium]|nr:translesion error-prone DNA polymerase V autoproteolytic subunit [Legionellaceae bacterium]